MNCFTETFRAMGSPCELRLYATSAERSAHAALRSLLTFLDVTAELLEDVLQDALPEESPTHSLPIQCSDLLM